MTGSADLIDTEHDRVPGAPGLYLDQSALAVEHEWHGYDRLEGIALGSAGR
jgi:hypothetical protein